MSEIPTTVEVDLTPVERDYILAARNFEAAQSEVRRYQQILEMTQADAAAAGKKLNEARAAFRREYGAL